MDEAVDSVFGRSLLEGSQEGSVLVLDHVQTQLDHFDVKHSTSDSDLGPCLEQPADYCVLLGPRVHALQD